MANVTFQDQHLCSQDHDLISRDQEQDLSNGSPNSRPRHISRPHNTGKTAQDYEWYTCANYINRIFCFNLFLIKITDSLELGSVSTLKRTQKK